MPPKRQSSASSSASATTAAAPAGSSGGEFYPADEFTRTVKKRLATSTRTGQACDRCKVGGVCFFVLRDWGGGSYLGKYRD